MTTAFLTQAQTVANPGTRTLLLVLLILAVLLVIAGAVIAVITFYYARKQGNASIDESAIGERR